MTTSPSIGLALKQLGDQIVRLQRDIAQLKLNQRTAQMGTTSVENGSITFNDAAGNPQLVSGLQPDGTYAHAAVGNQVPLAPGQPLPEAGILGIVVYWDGQMFDGSSPLSDFAGAQVYCSAVSGFTPGPTTLQGIMPSSGFFGVGNLTAGTTYYVCLVAVNAAGNTSPPSVQASAVPSSVPAGIPPGSITKDQIKTGTLTAAQLAGDAGILGTQLVAGIVVAGIIDGTIVEGAQIIGDGTGLEFVLYAGEPAADNMVLSSCTTATIDEPGNHVLDGFTFYGSSGPSAYFALNFAVSATGTGVINYYQATSQTGGWGPVLSGLGFQSADVTIPPTVTLAVGGAPGGSIQVTDATGAGTGTLTADANGNLQVSPEADINLYKVGHFCVSNTTAVNVNSTTGASGLLSINVGQMSYHITGYTIYSGNQAAGGAQISYGGSATISHADGWTSFARVGGGTHMDSGVTSLGAANSPTFPGSGTMQVAEFNYYITFSGVGTLTVLGLDTNAGDTWVAHSTYAMVEVFK